jgi:thiosulfate/3-mercaptopyruvate sulfurtransferase
MRHIVNAEWLYTLLKIEEVNLIDCRFVLGQPQAGFIAYQETHIPGAIYMDLEKDLSGPVRPDGVGGRHPLPDIQQWVATLHSLGIQPGRKVVAYDDQGGAMAARLWWLMRYIGYEQVYLLDGGFTAWQQAGYPVVAGDVELSEAPQRQGGDTDQPNKLGAPQIQVGMLATAADIEASRERIADGRLVLIDSREEVRYRGITEPIDKVAGHIPGAQHAFWRNNLDAQGRFRSLHEQVERFKAFRGAEEIIVYCGSGVTACPNVLALHESGFTNVRLYAGSWSDWISDPARPTAKHTIL